MRLGKFRVFDEKGRRLFEDSYYRPVEPETERAETSVQIKS
jgi:hypothetical protein